jgi:hypothetical protein
MPFLQEGGSVESDYVAAPAARLVVDPGKVLFLKRGFEEERDRVREWIERNRWRLARVPPPGSDPCSDETARILGENGLAAINAAQGYVSQLQKVAETLGEIARTYRLTEERNTQRLESKPR